MRHSYRTPEFYHSLKVSELPQLGRLDASFLRGMKRVAQIFQFRSNNYVVNELIDWDQVPDDPIFRLNFPHPGMLSYKHHRQLQAVRDKAPEAIRETVNAIRMSLNPNPAGQQDNVPLMDHDKVRGIQHKYAETVLIFPSEGQTCHAFCTFCFRWPQFIGISDLKFATDESRRYQEYIQRHREITDILITGGDPMVMNAETLAHYIEPFLKPEFAHIQTIRIGSKSLAYWPFRYISDPDSNQILRLFEQVVKSGRHLAFQAHINHPRELDTSQARKAIKNIQATGAVIRAQSPILDHINNDPAVWHELWNLECRLGIVPYYMFIARNTGAHHYFAVPLARAYQVYSEVVSHISGLARTVRGPSMSTRLGKVKVAGVTRISGQKVFILTYIESRYPNWVNRPFFARFNDNATWLDELQPAFDAYNFYFERKPMQLKQ